MKIQLIRSATMKISYAGKSILTDPMLEKKNAPITADLPLTVDEIVGGLDAVMVSHTHYDHFDELAKKIIPKETRLFCQPDDHLSMVEAGFKNCTAIGDSYAWEGITLTRTSAVHSSSDEVLKQMGQVSGFVLQSDGEPTVYWVGDSIWCPVVAETIGAFKPDVVITHSGGAGLGTEVGPIIMDAAQTLSAARAASRAVTVAIHLEALSFCPVTRADLRRMADDAGILASRLRIPKDGEVLSF
jgi:L-ascorbate metabolism protein UlaG (beta-lactamase superfamily)